MSQLFNIYCDESCHLENDKQQVMGLGSIWCPTQVVKKTLSEIKNIKKRFNLNSNFEVKWTKVSPGQTDFYLALIDYFFDKEYLHFRGLIIPDKSKINHNKFRQTHDDWYYKMYFLMIKPILDSNAKYRIYLDIKDTKSTEKTDKLREVLCTDMHDFSSEKIEKIQIVRSHEIEILQLTDLLLGAIVYVNKSAKSSSAKLAIIDKICATSKKSLTSSTFRTEKKMNLLCWQSSYL